LSVGLIRGSLSGPRLLTGGRFGPEASVVAMIVSLLVSLYFIRRIIASRRVQPPVWGQALRFAPVVAATLG
jgi:uncharacterized protein